MAAAPTQDQDRIIINLRPRDPFHTILHFLALLRLLQQQPSTNLVILISRSDVILISRRKHQMVSGDKLKCYVFVSSYVIINHSGKFNKSYFLPPPCVQHNISSRTYLYTQHMSQNDHITANSCEPGEEGMPVLQCFKDSVGQALDVEM